MPEHPCTAFTFDYLNTFHLLTLQGKINLYDYYKAILWKTDNVALQKQVYHWNKASMVIYQWQHLKMLKKAGRGHDLTGIEATKMAEKLSPKRPDGRIDPELGSGWAYFVMKNAYQDYLKMCKDQRKITMCKLELNAVKQAYSKGTNSSLSMTGILGKGERYCNVDYTILSVLKASCKTQEQKAVPDLNFSHDIVCNWYKNFYKWLNDMPNDMQILDDVDTHAMIPKAHTEGHRAKC
ncbi:hypothetical protein SCP_1101120 [Sparassis crispa]|uniref:CxC2-like cysteine cluster KDZ transposase-associated domain-containing protein n=1 Tax=Sparassis crispa TaxID=139825 RepID=A0A401GZ34_9APHY|nr:hypothetical protein SCP_1101120 [Sparassis crispa]GBE87436.1 hypothetical protein SCP_1101120 [Sparassis crispa]